MASTLCIHRDHPDFPIRAAAMLRTPEALYLRGPLPGAPGVAIVGTRAASDEAVDYTRRLAFELAGVGVPIWSGGATGIDAAAHRGAIEAGGRTVVVMGTGLDQVYPVEHRGLFQEVLEHDGAWLSLWPDEQKGTRWTFLQRNELLAALVEAVILIQAPLRSGARSTVAAARRMGRTVWVVPSAPWDGLGAGCLEELRAGAPVLPGLRELGRALGKRVAPAAGTARRGELGCGLSDAEKAVVKAVRNGCRHADAICGRTGLTAQEVSAALLTLSLRHVLVQGADGRLRTAS